VWVILPLAWTAWFIIWHPAVDLSSLRYLLLNRVIVIAVVIGIVAGGIAYLLMRSWP
jgi:hypothetical protein